MKNKNIYIGIMLGLLSFTLIRCDDNIDPRVEELDLKRVLAPLELKAVIRNKTTAELSWNVREDADSYVVEISEGLNFTTIVKTLNVLPTQIPYQVVLDGETQYSVRVKGISNNGKEDSKWATVVFETQAENIFEALAGEDIDATTVTLRWPAGSEVTHFTIVPGDVQRHITAQEKSDGVATIEGLTGDTQYTIKLFKDNKQRGSVTFTTLVDVGNAIRVYPEDDLLQVIASANPGDVLALFPGEYGTTQAPLTISITKSITINGVYPYNKPVIYGQVTCASAVTSITLKNLSFNGNGTIQQFFVGQAGADIGALSIVDCEVNNYQNTFIASTSTDPTAIKFGAITISGCYVHDMLPATGGDGFDFRGGVVGSLTVEKSTFANAFRSFLRMQVSSNTSFKNCTLYKVSALDNSNNTGLFRAGGTAGANNKLEVSNCLFVETGPTTDPIVNVQSGNFCRNSNNMVATPTYSNNNIYSCRNIFVGLYTSAAQVSATELNPGFENAAAGNFKVTNQTLIDNNVGDPRWLQ